MIRETPRPPQLPPQEARRFSLAEREEQLIRQSLVAAKFVKRRQEGKTLDALISDMDGTLYVRQGRSIHVGQNQETTRLLHERAIPFIVNTGRPAWDSQDDFELIAQMRLPPPDAVIAGTGTVIYWRDRRGQLRIDEAYAERMRQHPMIYESRGEARSHPFDPSALIQVIRSELEPFIRHESLLDVLVDQGPLLPDKTQGVEGLRLVIRNEPYEDMLAFARHVRMKVKGIKIDLSEMPAHTRDGQFTGWIHIIPSIAGKERAAEYLLRALHHALDLQDTKVHGHIVGDASNDLRALARGSHPEQDPFVLHQYGVQNLQAHTRTKLTRVQDALTRAKGQRRANFSMLNASGPDGVHEIIQAIS